MKKVIFSLALLLTCSLLGYAQKGISYQAIILDPNPIEIPGQEITGQPFVNGQVSLKFKLFSSTFVQEFEEVHTTQTDAYGTVNVLIGSVSPSAFSSLVWDSKQKSLHVLVSFDQGGTYTKVSEQQLTYNPMALFAETAGKLSETLSIAGGGTGATTAAAARTNLGLGNVDNTSDAAKPISSATQAALDTKANASEVTTALDLKANTADVTTSLNLKANANDVNTALATKANAAEVTTALATKANATEMATALATKADAAAVATSLGLKEDVSNKANTPLGSSTTLYPTQNAVKTYVDEQIASATLPDANSITKGKIQLAGDLGGTAGAPTVPGLALKANTNDVNTALALKAPIASPRFTGTVGVGTSNPSSSSVLEISSTTKGILIPRMTNTERSAITNPVNALLVFNTNNNRFEVYKTSCSCWIAISDGGSGIVVPPVNTIPTLNNMNYTGLFRVGGTGNVFYTYADSDGDVEQGTTINWEIANDNNGSSKTTYSTSNSPTFTAADAGRYVRVKVTPRAATGALNGIDYYGSWNFIDPATVPYASSISISGNAKQGSLLSGNYTFTGGSGIENAVGSTYTWQTATSINGANTSTITIPNGGSAFGKTIRPTINEVNRYIRFGVRAKDNASVTATNFVYSDWVGPVTISAEEAPIAADVLYSQVPGTSLKLTSSYTYVDANNDPEGTSFYQWYTASDATGANQAPIVDAKTKDFTPTPEQAGKYIGIGITPVAKTGTITGTEVVYYNSTPSAAAADFTFESVTQSSTNFYINRIMDATDYITLSINVTSPGSITFSTPTVDGYSFSGGGVYSTGLQNVILTAKGTQTAYNAAGDIFTITAIGSTTQTRTITITNTNIATTITNNPPSVSNINYRGVFRINGTASVVYSYADQEKDAEAATTIHWEIANDNNGAAKTLYSTSASPTFTAADAGKYVRTKITPRAATGLLNGIEYYGSWNLIDAASKPYATNVNISGKAEQGSTLTGAYTFNGGTNGSITYTESTLGSTYQWQTASNNKGVNIANMPFPDGGTAFGKTIRPTINDVNKYIRFGVIAKDNVSNSATNYVYSDWVGPITIAAETAPIAKDVSFSPAPGTFITAKAKYTYEDANNDPEGASTYQWYSATDASGANQTAISGATTTEFVITDEYAGKYIGFGIIPKALTGNLTGTEVVYYAPSASIPAANFTIVSATQGTNNFYKNRVMSASDYITLNINVTSAGSIKFTTNTANGYSFSADGLYSTGSQNVTLVAKGTLSAYNGTGDNFTITGLGATTNTTTTVINNVKLGGQFTDHYNGIVGGVHNTTNVNDATYYLKTSYTTGESFNNNTTCLTKPISTSACVGTTITVGSNTYSITTINGQCWMTQNLIELPNGVPINTSQSLSAAASTDLGYYGFYNLSSAVWALTAPAADEGMLYQWSAAMMGSTTERAKGACPSGWHIPSDCEWLYLEHGLGLSLVNQASTGEQRGNATTDGNVGSKVSLKVSLGTNSSGFTGLIAGRLQSGGFGARGGTASYWTSTAKDTNSAYTFAYKTNITGTVRGTDTKNLGFSIRCLKD